MNCLSCGGPLEFAGQNAAYARCTHCLALYTNQNRSLTPMQVQAPGGGNNPEFNAMYAQQLGFAPRQASHMHMQMGGVGVKINTSRLERDVKNKISGMIWGLVIGGFILLCIAGVFLYVLLKTKSAINESITSTTTPKVIAWDGKTPLECGGNEKVTVKGVTANIAAGTAISAAGSCEVDLTDVNITAPLPIEAGGNAKVTVHGGSLKGTPNAISAAGNAQVTLTGTKVDGKAQKLGNAKITGP